MLELKFLYVSRRNSTFVSDASTGSGVDMTSNVSDARNTNSDAAADLGWKNIFENVGYSKWVVKSGL